MNDIQARIAKHEEEIARLKLEAQTGPGPLAAQFMTSIHGQMAPTAAAMQLLTSLSQKALTSEDQAFLRSHIAAGAPGVLPFLDSTTIVEILQLGISSYREFLAGRTK